LSPREAEIMRLIASGLTNAEIAQQLFLSMNTIKSHIRAAYRKAGVETRAQAVIWGFQHGLVSVDVEP
jgi:two-component system, NarL family, response regulator LiaR